MIKSFRKVVWKTGQQVWARLHEEAWHALGGSCAYVVLDNLREGMIKPDLYEPGLNPVVAAGAENLASVYGGDAEEVDGAEFVRSRLGLAIVLQGGQFSSEPRCTRRAGDAHGRLAKMCKPVSSETQLSGSI